MNKLLVLFLLLNVFTITNGQWIWQSPSLPGSHLSTVAMLDDNTIVTSGGESMILKSTDGGSTWQRKDAGIFAWPSSLTFIGNTGWLFGYPENVLRTTDGGESWSVIYDFNETLFDMTFTDINSGWVCGINYIFKTINGGNSWDQCYYNSQAYLQSAFFINSLTGWCVGQYGYRAIVLKTNDGGNNWTSYQLPYVPDMEDVFFVNPDTGYAIGSDGALSGNNGFIWKTIDGGANWDTSFTGFRFSEIKFINSLTGFAVGADGTILRTTDGGNSWYNIPSGTLNGLVSITILNSGYGAIFGSNGVIIKTTDSGNNWSVITDGSLFNIYSIDFYNRYYGAAVGHSGKIMTTTNGGNQWEVNAYTAPCSLLLSVSYPTPLNIWASGWDGAIIHSSDGGNNWVQQNTGVSVPLRCIYFVNSNTGWAAGNEGIILKTTNSGSSWVPLNTQTTEWFKTIYFLDENNGWGAGDYSLLKKTTDGGLTWQDLTLAGYHFFSSIFFVNVNLGWAAEGPGILKTTDGGSSWVSQVVPDVSYINDIYFKNADTGWAAGRYGNIWITTNGGSNWSLQEDDIYNELYSIAHCETDELWISGNSSLILYSINGNTPVELNSLYVVTTGNRVNLKWSTSSETNNKGFDVEKYTTSDSWEVIGFVPGQGTTTEKHDYSFEDKIHSPGKYLYRLKQIDYDGTFSYSKTVEATIVLPMNFTLEQNYPNPFNPATTISYSVPKNTGVVIKIFDILGNEIETLVNEEKPAGQYEVNWNAVDMPSGVYFYELRAGSFVESKKMILMK